jgi:hypothetical protein
MFLQRISLKRQKKVRVARKDPMTEQVKAALQKEDQKIILMVRS